jgi:hypothetical protein
MVVMEIHEVDQDEFVYVPAEPELGHDEWGVYHQDCPRPPPSPSDEVGVAVDKSDPELLILTCGDCGARAEIVHEFDSG